MTERQKTVGALAVLAAAVGVYAEINYESKVQVARERPAAPSASVAPSASSSAGALPKP